MVLESNGHGAKSNNYGVESNNYGVVQYSSELS
jgi:hypothetical protein